MKYMQRIPSQYFRDIEKYSIISQEEELILAKRIENGDSTAIADLITANLGSVISIAKKFMNCGVPFEDLISEGNVGLTMAADRWDYKRKTRFHTYATFWIRKYILNAINKGSLVSSPNNLNCRTIALKKEIEQLTSNNGGYRPSIEEIREKFGKKYESIDLILNKLGIDCYGISIQSSHYLDSKMSTDSFEKDIEQEEGSAKLEIKLKRLLNSVRYGDIAKEIHCTGKNPRSVVKAIAKRKNRTTSLIYGWRKKAFNQIKRRHKYEDFVDYIKT